MLKSWWHAWLKLPFNVRLSTIYFFVGAGLVLGSLVWWKMPSPMSREKVEIVLEEPLSATKSSQLDSEKKIVVGIVGGVKNPGLYALPPNSRVMELVQQAGGLLKTLGSDPSILKLNIARILTDGETVVVGVDAAKGNAEIVNHAAETNSKLVRVNIATQSELEALPGIGPKYAQEMIEKRPFISPQDMQQKINVPEKVLSSIESFLSYE